MTRSDLIKRLTTAQNNKANVNKDIMTFAGFCNDAELLEHVERYEALAA